MDDHLSTNPKIFAINKQTDHHRKINIILKTQTQSGHRIRKAIYRAATTHHYAIQRERLCGNKE